MRRSMHVRIDLETARRTSTGLVVVGITFIADGKAFPAEGWADFAVVVLHSFSEAALDLLRGQGGPIEVRFMEGPYVVELSRVSTAMWRAALMEDRLKREIRSIQARPRRLP